MDYSTPFTLEIHNVYKSFVDNKKIHPVINGISAQFEQGTSYAIVGVSGSGKSTLLHLLGGLDLPTQGQVLAGGKNIAKLKQHDKNKLLNQSIGFIFQFHYLVKELNVIENVMVPGLINGSSFPTAQQRARKLLISVGLEGKQTSQIASLSGGEQQRVAIARALFNKPKFLLADEPTGNLDEENAQQVIDLIINAQRTWEMGVILCSHDAAVYNKMQIKYRLHGGQLT